MRLRPLLGLLVVLGSPLPGVTEELRGGSGPLA